MKLRTVINLGTSGKKAIGINVRLRESGEAEFAYCLIREEKGTFSISSQGDEIHSWKEVLDRIHTEELKFVRVHINIEGKGVLTKKTDADQEISEDFLNQFFPGFNASNFVLQVYTHSTASYISILRKEVLLNIVDPWVYSSFVQSASLGNYLLDSQHHKVLFNEKQESLALAYSSALCCFHPDPSLLFFGESVLEENKKKYRQLKDAHDHGKYAMAALLFIVMINFFLFFIFNSKVIELQSQAINQQDSEQKNKREEASTVRAEELYQHLGWRSNQVPIYLADQIGASINGDVSLTALELGIRDETVWQSDRKIRFMPSQIKVTGEAQSVIVLGEWLDRLRRFSWVKDIEQQKYDHVPQSSRSGFEFVIIVGELDK